MQQRRRGVFGSLGVLFGVLGLGGACLAEVQPGEFITKESVQKVEDLVSPGVAWCIRHGMTMKIIPYKRIGWPQAYKEATEKYAGQVRLAADGLSLDGYVAGQPFPEIDPNDPQVAVKIMWNYDHRPYPGTDDFVEYDFPASTGSLSFTTPMSVERHYWIGESRRLYFNGRLYVEPKPRLAAGEEVRFKGFLGPLVAPFDLRGIGALEVRYLDPAHHDDTWLYMPALRRVRRLSTAQRSDALFGQDTDADSYWGYNGHIAWMEWKFLGEKDMLGVFHGQHYPMQACADGADFAFCDSWEKRRFYVIEGTSKLPQYAYGKRVIFIDKEAWVVSYSDIYDRNLELWKVWIDNHQFRDQAFPGGRKYPEEQDFYAGLMMVDMQLSHATYVPHPGPEPAEHEGWFFNEGENSVTKYNPDGAVPEIFTVSTLIKRGH